MEDKRVHERKREAHGRFVYHEIRLPHIAARFKSEVLLRSLDDTVVATRKAFGDERPNRAAGGVIVSVPTVSGDKEGHWDFAYMLLASSYGREMRRRMLYNIQGLVSRAGLPSPDSGLDVLRLT